MIGTTRDADDANRDFVGGLDEVRIYSVGLSAERIQQIAGLVEPPVGTESRFEITRVTSMDGVSLMWSSPEDDARFTVSFSESLETDGWQVIADDLDSTNYTDTNAARTSLQAGYYRIELKP